MLTANDIIPRVVNYESIKIDSSSSEYYSFKTDSVQRIAIPIIQNLFCKDSLTCFSWSDMEVVILEVGKGHLFSKFSDNEFGLNNLISSYSIGALISRQKRQIVYWLYIYQT